MKKQHIPAEGKAQGTHGPALCGRWAHYQTGDHAHIRRLAAEGGGHWCQQCLRKL